MTFLRRAAVSLVGGSTLFAASCSGAIPVGAVISRTGAASVYGEKVQRGLDLALQEINASGGYHGRKLELIYRDDATDPETGLRVTQELIRDEGVRVIVGPLVSSVTLAVAPACEASHTVLLSPTASAPQITGAGEYIFRNYPSDVLEGASMARFARDIGLERVVIMALDNEFGSGLKAVFTQQYQSTSRRVLRAFDFRESDVQAFDPMVQEVAALSPDGLYIVGYLSDVAELLRRVRASGIRAVVLGASSVTEEIAELAGAAAEDLVFPQTTFDPESGDPAVRTFVRAYREAFDEEPDTYAAHGYDALKLLLLGMERGGSPHPDDIRRGLLGIDSYLGASGSAAFDDNGDVIQYPRIFIVRHGSLQPYDRFIEQGGSVPVPGPS